eukprot:4486815-Pleurochrysis_carterae.AAC.1
MLRDRVSREALLVGHVVDEQDSHRPAVVRGRDSSEALLRKASRAERATDEARRRRRRHPNSCRTLVLRHALALKGDPLRRRKAPFHHHWHISLPRGKSPLPQLPLSAAGRGSVARRGHAVQRRRR